MRLALDSNLLASAVLKPESLPGAVVGAWRQGHFTWVMCDQQFAEMQVAFARPKLTQRVARGAAAFVELLEQARMGCRWVTLAQPLAPICRDPRDDFLSALLTQGHVDGIVSGDADVQAHKTEHLILTPRELIARL